MTLRDQILSDVKNTFLNSNEFAETVSYTPYGSSPRSIKSIVFRDRLAGDGPDRGVALTRRAEILIANDATEGVSSVDKGRDTVAFPLQLGGANVTWTVLEVLSKDDGAWHLEVTR